MRTLCLILFCHASLQLQCGERNIIAHIGGELLVKCEYETNRFLYSKKYWCRGDSRSTCEILVDSEHRTKNTHRSQIVDAGRRGLFVKVTHLQFDDAGVYWVGIDKIYADIMTSVTVVITEVPVSKPRLWPLSSLVDGPTCWGQPVTVRCGCAKGTGVHYAWYQHTNHEDFLLHHSSDLHLQCGTVQKDGHYYCIASNDISSQKSDVLTVRVLMPADHSCIYVIYMQGQPFYDCDSRMSTCQTTVQTTVKIQQSAVKITRNWSLLTNQIDQDLFFSWTWTGVPFWYTLLRWGAFASLLIFLCVALKCIKARHKRAKRKRRVRIR